MSLQDLISRYETELEAVDSQVDAEGDRLVEGVEAAFTRFGEALTHDVVQPLDHAFEAFQRDGLRPCAEELSEGSTSMAVVGNNASESRPLMEELAIAKRVVAEIVDSFDKTAE